MFHEFLCCGPVGNQARILQPIGPSTCLMTNSESLNTFNLFMPSLLVAFNPTTRASHSALLFEQGKRNLQENVCFFPDDFC